MDGIAGQCMVELEAQVLAHGDRRASRAEREARRGGR
jgi:hypothetical protein